MKYILSFLCLLVVSLAAYAACTTNTITLPDGRMMICTTCCTPSGFCNTMCN